MIFHLYLLASKRCHIYSKEISFFIEIFMILEKPPRTIYDRMFARLKVNNARKKLPQVLSLFNLIFLGVSCTIGCGIYSVIGYAAQKSGPSIVISFLVGGVLCFFTCLPYAEFSAKIQSAGYAYSYAYATCGELIAFFTAGCISFSNLCACAVAAQCWGSYFINYGNIFGLNLPPWVDEVEIAGCKINVIGTILVFIFVGLILLGVKESTTVNNMICILNLATITCAIIAGTFYFDNENFTNDFLPFGTIGIFSGMGLTYFTYNGFEGTACFAEEVKNPERNLPLGLIFVLLIAVVANCGIAIIMTGMAPLPVLNTNDSLLEVFEYNKAPGWLQNVIALGSILGLTTSLSGNLIGQPRVFYGIASDGLLPKSFQEVHNDVLRFSALATGGFCILITMFLNVDFLGNATALMGLLGDAIVDISTVIARYEVNGVQNKGVNFGCVIFCVFSLFASYSVYYGWPLNITIGLFIVVIASFCYIQCQPQTNIPKDFACPFVPFFPMAGAFSMISIASTVGMSVWSAFTILTVCWMSLYFFYGIHKSHLHQDQDNNQLKLKDTELHTTLIPAP